MSVRIIEGDCRETLASLEAQSVQCCVCSPPYFGLRDYGHAGQLGLEKTPAEYVEKMVQVFREVRRVLRDDGTLWLNIGDSYASIGHKKSSSGYGTTGLAGGIAQSHTRLGTENNGPGLKHKDLIGIPWMLAFAFRADGWYLRSDIIWAKPNPMPESVTDRPTKSHEYLFLLSKRSTYYYDADAIREPLQPSSISRLSQPSLALQAGSDRVPGKTNGNMKAVPPRRSGNTERLYGEERGRPGSHLAGSVPWEDDGTGRNRRSVWTVATQPYSGAHFATFPCALIEPCIKAGSRRDDTVLDPFGGAGTTGLVADRLGRNAILCELNPAYAEMARRRITDDSPLLAGVTA